jgi:predicted phage baseplate assembly protein
VVDETRALTLSGFVRFRAPVNHQPIAPGEPFFIRCRIVRGRFECTPMVSHVAFNAVEVEHALSVPEREIGSARGHAAAVFSLGNAPVVASSVHLRLDDGAGDTQDDWREAPDFERAGPHDRVFVLDPERGEIKSGDGLRAAVLPAGFTLFASYRLGGGTAGNVAAQTLTQIPASAANVALAPALSSLALPLSIDQPFDAAGGAPREMLASAQSRAFDIVNEVDKAVTLDDIERLALETPGVPVARVRAVANHAAELPCYPAAGVTTLIVIPPCSPPAPMPSRALLDAVEDYLQRRRLVTSEIHAIAPSYRRISVAAVLHLACEADAAKTLQRAQAALDRFLDPLRGGPANTGWEFGRTVYRSEVFALLAAVDGVVRITELTLIDGFPSTSATKSCGCVGTKASSGHCDNIDLCVHELVRPGRHRLTIQSAIPQNLVRSDAHECGSA